jgi:alpha-tubulin suppressor-like RCC1 family protein
MMRSVLRGVGLGTLCVLLMGLMAVPVGVMAVPASAGSAIAAGSVLAFGNNVYGELGSTANLGITKPNPTPTVVSLPGARGNVTQAAVGDGFSLVLTSTGQVFGFGANPYGQLGNTTNNGKFTANPTPALVRFPGIQGQVTQIAAGGNFSLALTSAGQLYGFGSDFDGDLGTPPRAGTGTVEATPTPTPITLPGLVGKVTQIAAGLYHSLVLSSTGQLYAFGSNWWGQLGSTTNVGTYKPNPTPALVSMPGTQGQVTGIAAGADFSLALTSAGQLYGFGDNAFGELGTTANNGKLLPNPTPTPLTIPGLSAKVTQIAAGSSHSLALTSTGQLYAFGRNVYGGLGNSTNIGDTGYVANPTPTLVALSGIEGHITQVAASDFDTLVVTSSGQLYTFGYNGSGQLGVATGTSTPHPTPTPVDLPAGTRIGSVAVGSSASHTLAIVAGGELEVSVEPLEALRSGLAVHSVHYKEYPVDFTAVERAVHNGPPTHFACQSGCVDITVTVDDPPRGSVEGDAMVDASLGELRPGTQDWDGHSSTPPVYGDGYLCATALNGADEQCSTSLSGLRTDTHGQVHLRYWAPGVVAEASTALTVTASCRADTSCTGSPQTSDTTLTVKPYEIYEHNAELEDVGELLHWASGPSGFSKFLEESPHGVDVLKEALEALEAFEKAAEVAKEALEVVEEVEPIGNSLEVVHLFGAAFEAQGMFALFLKDSGLSPFGIGSDPFEASASGNPTTNFVRELMNQLAVPSFLKVSNGGFWWASAEAIRKIIDIGESNNPPSLESLVGWSLETSVYEVSHCDHQRGTCGPGYGNEPGRDVVNNAGIQPELVFELRLVHAGVAVEQLGFSITYDALAWTTTQPHLQGVIQDF